MCNAEQGREYGRLPLVRWTLSVAQKDQVKNRGPDLLRQLQILLPNDDLHPDSGGCLEWSPLQSFSGVVIAASSALVTCSHSIACRTRDATHPRYSVSCIVRLCPLIIVILSPVSLLAVVFMPDAELEEVKHLRCRNFARV